MGMCVLLQVQRSPPADRSSWKAESSHEPSADELPWERRGMESCCSPVPSLLLSLSRAERCCAVLVTSSDKLVSVGSWLGGFGAPGQFPAGHRLVSLSGSLGAALVLGLRYCCFTVKCKLNSDTHLCYPEKH